MLNLKSNSDRGTFTRLHTNTRAHSYVYTRILNFNKTNTVTHGEGRSHPKGHGSLYGDYAGGGAYGSVGGGGWQDCSLAARASIYLSIYPVGRDRWAGRSA